MPIPHDTRVGSRRHKAGCKGIFLRDITIGLRNAFKAACELHGTSMRREFMKFMAKQVRDWENLK